MGLLELYEMKQIDYAVFNRHEGHLYSAFLCPNFVSLECVEERMRSLPVYYGVGCMCLGVGDGVQMYGCAKGYSLIR